MRACDKCIELLTSWVCDERSCSNYDGKVPEEKLTASPWQSWAPPREDKGFDLEKDLREWRESHHQKWIKNAISNLPKGGL